MIGMPRSGGRGVGKTRFQEEFRSEFKSNEFEVISPQQLKPYPVDTSKVIRLVASLGLKQISYPSAEDSR